MNPEDRRALTDAMGALLDEAQAVGFSLIRSGDQWRCAFAMVEAERFEGARYECAGDTKAEALTAALAACRSK